MGMKYGGPREDRTPNPLIKSQLLCQLSYRPALFLSNLAQKLNYSVPSVDLPLSPSRQSVYRKAP